MLFNGKRVYKNAFYIKVTFMIGGQPFCLMKSGKKVSGKDFRIIPYIYYACRVINYVCTLLFEKTIATP